MKTIKELYDAKELSTRAYNAICRNIGKYFRDEKIVNPNYEYQINGMWFIDYDEEP